MNLHNLSTVKLRPEFKHKPAFFLRRRDSPRKTKVTLLVVREGMPITVITYRCLSIYLLSLVITRSEQVVPSAVAHCIIVTFLTNGKVKSAEILKRLRDSTVRQE